MRLASAIRLVPLTKKVKWMRSPSLFMSAANSVRSRQRSSSVQLSNAITTNCGGRSTSAAAGAAMAIKSAAIVRAADLRAAVPPRSKGRARARRFAPLLPQQATVAAARRSPNVDVPHSMIPKSGNRFSEQDHARTSLPFPLRSQIEFRRDRRISIQMEDQRHASCKLPFQDLLGVEALQHHHQRAQRIAMRGHEHVLAAQHARQNFLDVVRQHARRGILEALAARRRHVIGAPPDLDLLLAPFLARIVLVKAREVTVITLVERQVLDHRDVALAHLLKDEVERTLRTLECRGVTDVEADALRLELAAGIARFRHAVLSEVDVLPAGEQVGQVPFALTMAHEHKQAVSHWSILLILRP